MTVKAIVNVCPRCQRVRFSGSSYYVASYPLDASLEGAVLKTCDECANRKSVSPDDAAKGDSQWPSEKL
jgi:ribosome-binding protein aMBF1 (putative translation factor)